MKVFDILLVAACFVTCVHSFPGARTDEDEDMKSVETHLVLPSKTSDRFIRPINFEFPDTSFEDLNLFGSLYNSIQNYLQRMRDRWTVILSGIPDPQSLPGANTTSTTKIIDGHVVTVNETTYVNDDLGTVIRVRVIDMKPVSTNETEVETTTQVTVCVTPSASGEEKCTTSPRSVETVEDFDNEIPKNQVDTLTA